MKFSIFCVVSCFLSVMAVSPPECRGGTSQPWVKIWMRESQWGTDYEVKVDFNTSLNKLVGFGNAEDCGNATHKTSLNRRFTHLHVNYGIGDLSGVDENDVPRVVTFEKIRWYYDAQYTGYEPFGTEALDLNCHGWALTMPTLVLDCAEIDADNFQAATDWPDTKVLRGEGNDHSIAVLFTENESSPYEIATSEKNGESRIYSKIWQSTSPPNGSSVKRKPK